MIIRNGQRFVDSSKELVCIFIFYSSFLFGLTAAATVAVTASCDWAEVAAVGVVSPSSSPSPSPSPPTLLSRLDSTGIATESVVMGETRELFF